MKIFIALLITVLLNTSSQNFPEKKEMLTKSFSRYENFFPLATLDLRNKGIKDKIHIMYVSLNYNGSPNKDSNFPDGEDIDHFTFKIDKDGLYNPTFSRQAMRMDSAYLPSFKQTKQKYLKVKAENFQVQEILQMGGKPYWLQHDATPVNSKGEKFMFICQFEALNISSDDSWVYVFYDKTDRQVRYVHQRT